MSDDVTVHHGKCEDVLPGLPDASFDACVTDPPYDLTSVSRNGSPRTNDPATPHGRTRLGERGGFMGKTWDGTGVAFKPETWALALRVLKPGGHLLAFGGSRTFHRLACAIEDAGFEIRDTISWLYGSGFPKSRDVSKAIDATLTRGGSGSQQLRARDGRTIGTVGTNMNSHRSGRNDVAGDGPAAELATDDARRWQGWGTALKPAWEPIIVARKPLAGTVAGNVLAHGTGALNIDGTRIPHRSEADRAESEGKNKHADYGTLPGGNEVYGDYAMVPSRNYDGAAGRWPANVVLDEDAAAQLDRQSGISRDGVAVRHRGVKAGMYGPDLAPGSSDLGYGGEGGASRFYYTAKAAPDERPFYYRPACDCEEPWPTTSRARATAATARAASSSTSKSGNDTTDDPSPTATRSTTSTATSSTTIPPTSSQLRPPSTSESTPAANSATGNGGSPAASAASPSPSLPSTGTSRGKGGRSTADAARATSGKWSATSVCGECGQPARREAHATVKPLDLMRWLVRLVTPPGGLVLDPFAGSGTTGEACLVEGFRCVLIEREADYLPLIHARLSKPIQLTLGATRG